MTSALTKKEIKILRLRYNGLRNKDIARELGLTEPDVSQTLGRAVKKINTVNETLSLMQQIGVLEDDITIEFTDKGKAILGKWQTEWDKSFKNERCVIKQPQIKVKPFTINESELRSSDINVRVIEDIYRKLEDLGTTVNDIRIQNLNYNRPNKKIIIPDVV